MKVSWGQDLMTESCKHRNEPPCSTEAERCHTQLTDYQLLKECVHSLSCFMGVYKQKIYHRRCYKASRKACSAWYIRKQLLQSRWKLPSVPCNKWRLTGIIGRISTCLILNALLETVPYSMSQTAITMNAKQYRSSKEGSYFVQSTVTTMVML
jgi:hypothetical protein